MATVVITGANGFVGRNLTVRLQEQGVHSVIGLTRSSTEADVEAAVAAADFVVHLAGVNRTADPDQFTVGNVQSTSELCRLLELSGRKVPVVYASSTQAGNGSDYGTSKLEAENEILDYGGRTGAGAAFVRLPNIFGKWARPNYNSAVATFCNNIAAGLPITIHNPDAALNLIYIDDVVDGFMGLIEAADHCAGQLAFDPVYATTVGEVAAIIRSFPETRDTLLAPRAGTGLTRALYATYLTYLEPRQFSYTVPIHADPRGQFVEMLKTPDFGQFSYFTSGPGITRGDHYHHSKVEKFLVLAGKAHFGFRNIQSGDTAEIITEGGEGRVVETIPGWTHNITNIGDDMLVVMLWANEIFDRARPDTIAMKV
jgi:UDP-2-acetamido-2,6-beta-L-arabino-hexul-4-ose reductase